MTSLREIAYQAWWRKAKKGLRFNPLEDRPREIQSAWQAAALAVRDEVISQALEIAKAKREAFSDEDFLPREIALRVGAATVIINALSAMKDAT